jgi:low molecular weight protein-tyrosine phosphatase
MMPHSILCVCLGNICRSPSGQGALERAMPGAVIDSAGTSNWHIGGPPYGPMQAAARAQGLDLGGQRARQVCPEDFARFDLILAMDAQNLTDLKAMQPQGSPAKLALFLDVLEDGPRDVPDPYYTRDFDGVLALIDRAAHAWAARL